MTKNTLIILILASLMSSAWASDKKGLNDYYRNVYLGEKKTKNYFGPLDPRSEYRDNVGDLVLLDDLFGNSYLRNEVQGSTFDLHDFWFNQVVEKSSCPDETLNENIDYIRYLYRLVSISYLFESIKLNHKISSQLGLQNTCSIKYKDLFSKCTPKTSDMKKFHQRVYGKFVNEIDKIKYDTFTKAASNQFLETFRKTNSLTTDPVFSRLHQYCIANKKNCRTLTLPEINEALGTFCSGDIKQVGHICSEEDSLYGQVEIKTPTQLIVNSNAFNLINQTGMGEECLRRFGKLFKVKEISYTPLVKQFPLVYSHLLKNNSRYIQGELFLPGALKEFDMKGLSDFLTALKPPAEEPVIEIPKPPVVEEPKPVVVVEAPKVELPPVIEAPPVVEEVPVKISEFESKTDLFARENPRYLDINMDAFKSDFSFTEEMLASLAGSIKRFQTRTALVEMKSYDSLGSIQAPVGLIFLKYLIDTNNHQGLYNITSVIGEKFYVMNDIEEKTEAHLITLKNDASTKHKWQITLIQK